MEFFFVLTVLQLFSTRLSSFLNWCYLVESLVWFSNISDVLEEFLSQSYLRDWSGFSVCIWLDRDCCICLVFTAVIGSYMVFCAAHVNWSYCGRINGKFTFAWANRCNALAVIRYGDPPKYFMKRLTSCIRTKSTKQAHFLLVRLLITLYYSEKPQVFYLFIFYIMLNATHAVFFF